MYGYVYKTTNLLNDKIYVGQKKSDVFLHEEYLGSGKILQAALLKYGRENFTVELLEECSTPEELNKREIYWIDKLDSTNSSIGYNISPGGTGGNVTRNFSAERRSNWISKVIKNRGPRVAVNNGVVSKYIRPEQFEEYINDGWSRGLLVTPKRIEGRKKCSISMQNKVYYTNGVSNTLIDSTDVDGIEKLTTKGYYKGFTVSKIQKESIKRKIEFYQSKRDAYMSEWWSNTHYCEVCGKVITSYIGTGRFCSRSCASTHPHTEETKNKLRELNLSGVCGRRGFTMSEEERIKHSNSALLYYSTHKTCWINNGTIDKRVPIEQLSQFVDSGWVRGRVPGRQVAWNKGLTVDDPRVLKNRQTRDKTMLERYGTLDGYKASKIRKDRGLRD